MAPEVLHRAQPRAHPLQRARALGSIELRHPIDILVLVGVEEVGLEPLLAEGGELPQLRPSLWVRVRVTVGLGSGLGLRLGLGVGVMVGVRAPRPSPCAGSICATRPTHVLSKAQLTWGAGWSWGLGSGLELGLGFGIGGSG